MQKIALSMAFHGILVSYNTDWFSKACHHDIIGYLTKENTETYKIYFHNLPETHNKYNNEARVFWSFCICCPVNSNYCTMYSSLAVLNQWQIIYDKTKNKCNYLMYFRCLIMITILLISRLKKYVALIVTSARGSYNNTMK